MNQLSGTRILRVIFPGGTSVPLFQLTYQMEAKVTHASSPDDS
jgi:hypothetical protein